MDTAESPPEDIPFHKRRRPELLAAGAYLLLSCLYAWRVLANFATHLAGHGGDGFQNLWNMWWFKQALYTGSNPYFTDLLHRPEGTTLLFHTLNPFNCLLALPLDWIFGQPTAYNLVFLFCFTASGFTMYLLVRELFDDHLGAFLAGCVFTFSHYHFAHAQGHLNLIAMEFVPLFILGLVRLWRHRRLRDGVLMGVALSLCTFCDLYYTVFAVFLAGCAVVVELVRNHRRVFEKKLLISWALGCGIFLLTGGLLVIAMLVAYLQTEFVPTHSARYWSADLQGFFVPGWISMYGEAFAGIFRRWTGNSAENCWYLGYSVLALGVLAFVFRRKGERPWAWAGLVVLGVIISLGPVLHWGGKIHDDVPLPFALLSYVFPFLKMSGAPGRWHFLALVGTSVLAGCGAAALRARLAGKQVLGISIGTASVAAAVVLVLTELLPHWIEAREIRQPGFLEALKQEPAEHLVYDLGDDNRALLRQTGHAHPMIGGYISRPTRAALSFVRYNPVLRALRGERSLPPESVHSWARDKKLRFLIVPVHHKANRAMSTLGCRLRFHEGRLQVWEIPWPE